MFTKEWLNVFIQLLVLIPAALSCYYTTKNQMKYTMSRTALICFAAIFPYSVLAALLCSAFHIDANLVFLPSLIGFFFVFRNTVTASLPKCLAIYVGVCAVQTFPAQFAYCFDAFLHPESGAADFSTEAALFQLALSCLIAAAFAWPAIRHFYRMVDLLDHQKIWYSAVALSSVVLIINVACIPQSYSNLHAGRSGRLFPLIEVGMLAILTSIYLLFYYGTSVILEHAKLKEHTHLLEMQSHQFRELQEYMRQTSRLRHDFKHSVHLLSALADKGEYESIRAHLSEYDRRLSENISINYCSNAALNALFGYYHEMANSENIRTNWKIELPEPLTISELDMAALFGNIMENAISACATLPKEERYFNLTAELRHGNSLYVVSTNSFDGNVRKGKDGYHSTKHSGHGTGLISIAAVAEKYGGSAQFSNSDKEFYADVVMKI